MYTGIGNRSEDDSGAVLMYKSADGLSRGFVHTRSFLTRSRDGEIRLRVNLDRFSVEVFVNDGEAAAGAVISPARRRTPSPLRQTGRS